MITSTADENGNIVLTLPADEYKDFAWALTCGENDLYNNGSFAEEARLREIIDAIWSA